MTQRDLESYVLQKTNLIERLTKNVRFFPESSLQQNLDLIITLEPNPVNAIIFKSIAETTENLVKKLRKKTPRETSEEKSRLENRTDKVIKKDTGISDKETPQRKSKNNEAEIIREYTSKPDSDTSAPLVQRIAKRAELVVRADESGVDGEQKKRSVVIRQGSRSDSSSSKKRPIPDKELALPNLVADSVQAKKPCLASDQAEAVIEPTPKASLFKRAPDTIQDVINRSRISFVPVCISCGKFLLE